MITSGLNTNFTLSPSYSFHKSLHHKSCFFFFLAYLYSAGTQHGNLHPARWSILFCGPTQEPVLAAANTGKKLGRSFGKNAGEWTGRVEISKEKSLAISVACMAICLPTPGFKWRTFKLCVLNKWDFNFCVRSSPLRGPIMDNMFSPPTCDTYFQISCRGFSPSTPVCSLSLWFRSIRLWNEVVCLLVFWAQSAASRGYIRAEYELLIYLSVTQHTSHLTSTTIFLQHNNVKHTHTDTRTYTQTHTHTISIKKTPSWSDNYRRLIDSWYWTPI